MPQFTQRQRQILDTAVQIIAEQGIQELTVKRLSHRIGISEPALYRHFENKLAILMAILDSFAEWSRHAVEKVLSSGASPPEQVRGIFRAHIERFQETPAMAGILFSEAIFRNEKQLAEAVFAIMRQTQASLQEVVAKGVGNGSFRADVPVEHLVMIVMGALRLLVTRWHLAQYGFDLRDAGTALLASVLTLISAR